MKEARCRECGAIYKFDGEKLPKSVACLCECKSFEVLAEAHV